jgi:Arc/MetJ family transcription regulator
MRTTVTLDDDLVADAAAYSGIDDKSKLINLALTDFVRRSAAKRLVALGGTMPDLVVPARNSSRMTDDDSPAREAARALAALGGTMPDLDLPPRRRPEYAQEAENYAKVAEDELEYKVGKPQHGQP